MSNGFHPKSAAEILAGPTPIIDWIWDKYIPRGSLFIFAAYMKVGKTTFIYALAMKLARGEDFLDHSTSKSGVLILALEEHQQDVQSRLRKLGMSPDDPIYVHHGSLNPGDLAVVEQFINDDKIGLVLVDSLSYYWNVNNENDNAQVMGALKPLLELARRTDAAIGLIHHEVSMAAGMNMVATGLTARVSEVLVQSSAS